MQELETVISKLAKFGAHAALLLYPNGSGQVLDGHGRVVFDFGNLEELKVKLCSGSTMKNQNSG